METQSNKLWNVKTMWIFMLEPTKRVMNEYYTLVVKMDLDFASNNFAKFTPTWYWGLIWANSFVAIVGGNEQLDEVGPSLWCFYCWLCDNNKTLSSIFVFTFCGPSNCFEVQYVLFFQVFGGFLSWPPHHAMHIGPKYMYWTFNLRSQWTTHLGKTSWPTNKGCEFCDKKCAHLGCGNHEKSSEKSCWILDFKVVIPLSFTWCYGSLGAVFI
jgi:hypothetical protein